MPIHEIESWPSSELTEWIALYLIESEEAKEQHLEQVVGGAMSKQRGRPFRGSM